MGLRVTDFPRPAFYRDVPPLLAKAGNISAVILVDGEVDAVSAHLLEWANLLAGARVILICRQHALEKLTALDGLQLPNVELIPLEQWEAASLASNLLKMLEARSDHPSIFLSCVPYDSYGVVVKQELESGLHPLVERWNAFYFVHDPAFKTIRVFDKSLLHDRLVNRPHRLRKYAAMVGAIFRFAGIAARLTAERKGWRRA
ncbi:hypothetical protein BH11PSE11_BH11PSE11_02560 [soil metagenome]